MEEFSPTILKHKLQSVMPKEEQLKTGDTYVKVTDSVNVWFAATSYGVKGFTEAGVFDNERFGHLILTGSEIAVSYQQYLTSVEARAICYQPQFLSITNHSTTCYNYVVFGYDWNKTISSNIIDMKRYKVLNGRTDRNRDTT